MTELFEIKNVTECALTENLEGEKTLTFTAALDEVNAALINDTNIISLDGDWYDIAVYNKQESGGSFPMVTVDCEHVSYRLNNDDVPYFAATGTPSEVLATILDGSEFSVGAVEFAEPVTYSAQQEMSRRALVIDYAKYLGGELVFNGYDVSIVEERGSGEDVVNLTASQNITLMSKQHDKRTGEYTYIFDLYDPPYELKLGGTVSAWYGLLDINVMLRVVEIVTNPYDAREVKITVGALEKTLQDDLYRIETQGVSKDKLYNGCRIGPVYGFENMRSDEQFRSYFKADGFAMQTKDGSSWKDRLSVVWNETTEEFDLMYNGGFSVSTTARLSDQWGAADALILTTAQTHADGVGASIELSVAANYINNAAGAQLLLDAQTYADGAVSSFAAVASSTYQTQTAAAQLLLDAKAYTDGEVSSASASLTTDINGVGAALSLYVSQTAPNTYQSKATLSADVVTILSSNFSIVGEGGTATIVDADIYGDDIYSFQNYDSAYSNNGYLGYYGEYTRVRRGRMTFGEVYSQGTNLQFGNIGYNSFGLMFIESVSSVDMRIASDNKLMLETVNGLMIDTTMYGPSLPTTNLYNGRLFFKRKT